MNIWEKHWNVGDIPDYATTSTDDTVDPTKITVSRAEIDDFRGIMRSFKSNTAVAFDNLRPHQVAYLSDEAIIELIKLYKRCEILQRWPQIWKTSTMVMIPKAEEDKWRLIAILATPYRIWARRAGEMVSIWA